MEPNAEGVVDRCAKPLFALNATCIIWFTMDIVLRLFSWPGFVKYWRNILNILDVISVLPFYISLFHWISNGSDYFVLRVLRLARVIRIFKYVKHSDDLMIMMRAITAARKELSVLLLVMVLFVVSFGSIMFYIENDNALDFGHPQNGTDGHAGPNTHFTSILQSCWWVIVTISTVGFGDMYPTTLLGKVVGSLIICLGLVSLALPMTIIVTKFSLVYDRERL